MTTMLVFVDVIHRARRWWCAGPRSQSGEMVRMPDSPAVRRFQLSALPVPSGETTPIPVMTTTGRPFVSALIPCFIDSLNPPVRSAPVLRRASDRRWSRPPGRCRLPAPSPVSPLPDGGNSVPFAHRLTADRDIGEKLRLHPVADIGGGGANREADVGQEPLRSSGGGGLGARRRRKSPPRCRASRDRSISIAFGLQGRRGTRRLARGCGSTARCVRRGDRLGAALLPHARGFRARRRRPSQRAPARLQAAVPDRPERCFEQRRAEPEQQNQIPARAVIGAADQDRYRFVRRRCVHGRRAARRRRRLPRP